MIQMYRCGHQGPTCGFWKDDFWFELPYDCPKCEEERRRNCSYVRIVIRDNRVLVLTPLSPWRNR